MLRKELQKKMQAVAMAAVVTLTTVGAPATTFAGELPGELTAEAFSDNGEAVTEEVTEDDFSDGETAAGQSSAGENEVVDVPAAQAEESSEGSTEDEQAKAQAYLKENFIDGSNKIITSGGTGVTKSEPQFAAVRADCCGYLPERKSDPLPENRGHPGQRTDSFRTAHVHADHCT